LNRQQRRVFIEKVPDVANVAVGALFFGQFLGDRPFSFLAALSGIVVWFLLMMWAVLLAAKGVDL
jgi:hypothetical protein